MKRRNHSAVLALLLATAAVLTVTALAAEPGSSKDPLVTLSYLNDTYWEEIMDRVENLISRRNRELTAELSELAPAGGSASAGTVVSGGDTFVVVTVPQGQTLTGGIGCEVLLRVGSATCVAASAPGLIDETTGTSLNGGSALVQNHLYMMTVEGRGVRAGSSAVKLLVRGSYTIG